MESNREASLTFPDTTTDSGSEQVEVKVYVRLRPLSLQAVEQCGFPMYSVSPHDSKILELRGSYQKDHTSSQENNETTEKHSSKSEAIPRYTINGRFYDEKVGNTAIYEDMLQPHILLLTEGISSSLIFYGNCGSGKTHTLFGNLDTPGLLPQAIGDLLAHIRSYRHESSINAKHTLQYPVAFPRASATEMRYGTEFSIRCTCMELLNEAVSDILYCCDEFLDSANLPNLSVSDRPNEKLRFGEVLEVNVRSEEDLIPILARAINFRKARDKYTRGAAHLLVTLTVEKALNQRGKCLNEFSRITEGTLLIVETSDSSLLNSGSPRKRQRVNRSLFYLTEVLLRMKENAKGDKRRLIPYQKSLLTRILKYPLSTNSLIIIFATVDPSNAQVNSSSKTLRFAEAVSGFNCNVYPTLIEVEDSHLHRLKWEVLRKKMELAVLSDVVSHPMLNCYSYPNGVRKAKFIQQLRKEVKRNDQMALFGGVENWAYSSAGRVTRILKLLRSSFKNVTDENNLSSEKRGKGTGTMGFILEKSNPNDYIRQRLGNQIKMKPSLLNGQKDAPETEKHLASSSKYIEEDLQNSLQYVEDVNKIRETSRGSNLIDSPNRQIFVGIMYLQSKFLEPQQPNVPTSGCVGAEDYVAQQSREVSYEKMKLDQDFADGSQNRCESEREALEAGHALYKNNAPSTKSLSEERFREPCEPIKQSAMVAKSAVVSENNEKGPKVIGKGSITVEGEIYPSIGDNLKGITCESDTQAILKEGRLIKESVAQLLHSLSQELSDSPAEKENKIAREAEASCEGPRRMNSKLDSTTAPEHPTCCQGCHCCCCTRAGKYNPECLLNRKVNSERTNCESKEEPSFCLPECEMNPKAHLSKPKHQYYFEGTLRPYEYAKKREHGKSKRNIRQLSGNYGQNQRDRHTQSEAMNRECTTEPTRRGSRGAAQSSFLQSPQEICNVEIEPAKDKGNGCKVVKDSSKMLLNAHAEVKRALVQSSSISSSNGEAAEQIEAKSSFNKPSSGDPTVQRCSKTSELSQSNESTVLLKSNEARAEGHGYGNHLNEYPTGTVGPANSNSPVNGGACGSSSESQNGSINYAEEVQGDPTNAVYGNIQGAVKPAFRTTASEAAHTQHVSSPYEVVPAQGVCGSPLVLPTAAPTSSQEKTCPITQATIYSNCPYERIGSFGAVQLQPSIVPYSESILQRRLKKGKRARFKRTVPNSSVSQSDFDRFFSAKARSSAAENKRITNNDRSSYFSATDACLASTCSRYGYEPVRPQIKYSSSMNLNPSQTMLTSNALRGNVNYTTVQQSGFDQQWEHYPRIAQNQPFTSANMIGSASMQAPQSSGSVIVGNSKHNSLEKPQASSVVGVTNGGTYLTTQNANSFKLERQVSVAPNGSLTKLDEGSFPQPGNRSEPSYLPKVKPVVEHDPQGGNRNATSDDITYAQAIRRSFDSPADEEPPHARICRKGYVALDGYISLSKEAHVPDGNDNPQECREARMCEVSNSNPEPEVLQSSTREFLAPPVTHLSTQKGLASGSRNQLEYEADRQSSLAEVGSAGNVGKGQACSNEKLSGQLTSSLGSSMSNIVMRKAGTILITEEDRPEVSNPSCKTSLAENAILERFKSQAETSRRKLTANDIPYRTIASEKAQPTSDSQFARLRRVSHSLDSSYDGSADKLEIKKIDAQYNRQVTRQQDYFETPPRTESLRQPSNVLRSGRFKIDEPQNSAQVETQLRRARSEAPSVKQQHLVSMDTNLAARSRSMGPEALRASAKLQVDHATNLREEFLKRPSSMVKSATVGESQHLQGKDDNVLIGGVRTIVTKKFDEISLNKVPSRASQMTPEGMTEIAPPPLSTLSFTERSGSKVSGSEIEGEFNTPTTNYYRSQLSMKQ